MSGHPLPKLGASFGQMGLSFFEATSRFVVVVSLKRSQQQAHRSHPPFQVAPFSVARRGAFFFSGGAFLRGSSQGRPPFWGLLVQKADGEGGEDPDPGEASGLGGRR